MPTVNARWFRNQITTHKITQRKWARALNLDPSAVCLILSGKRKLQLDEATITSRLFNVPLEEVLVNAGISAARDRGAGSLEIGGWIDGESRVHFDQPKGPKTAPIPGVGGRGVKVLRYQTSGSALDSLDGTLMYYLDAAGVGGDVVGRLAVVQLGGRGGGSVIGVLKRGYGSGTFTVTDMAGRTIEEDVIVKSAAPVVWMKL